MTGPPVRCKMDRSYRHQCRDSEHWGAEGEWATPQKSGRGTGCHHRRESATSLTEKWGA